MLAFKLEGEVIGKMSTFVIATKKEECIRIPDLQSPEIEHALST